jgi:periplasmic divalent cation tolerance protein
MQDSFIEVILTCTNKEEAQAIATSLLDKHLVACVESSTIESRFWWKGNIEEANEVRLTMLSSTTKFDTIYQQVKKIHSYDTPALRAVPISEVTSATKTWLRESINGQ